MRRYLLRSGVGLRGSAAGGFCEAGYVVIPSNPLQRRLVVWDVPMGEHEQRAVGIVSEFDVNDG